MSNFTFIVEGARETADKRNDVPEHTPQSRMNGRPDEKPTNLFCLFCFCFASFFLFWLAKLQVNFTHECEWVRTWHHSKILNAHDAKTIEIETCADNEIFKLYFYRNLYINDKRVFKFFVIAAFSLILIFFSVKILFCKN